MLYMYRALDKTGDRCEVLMNGHVIGKVIFNDEDYPDFPRGWYISSDNYKKRFETRDVAGYQLSLDYSKK